MCTSTPPSCCVTAATGVSSRVSNDAPEAIASRRLRVPVGESDAAARELGECEAPARERMPAEDADGAGLIEPAVRDGLELGREDVALLVVQLELVEPLGDRLAVEAREPVGAEQRVMGLWQRLLDAVDELVPAALGDRVPLGDRPGAALVADEPALRRRRPR